jgi:hypothetical protein
VQTRRGGLLCERHGIDVWLLAFQRKQSAFGQLEEKGADQSKRRSVHLNAKSIGDARVSEAGRQLLAEQLQRLLDAETSNGTITKVFAASRNAERDRPPQEWTAEFVRKARMIIDEKITNLGCDLKKQKRLAQNSAVVYIIKQFAAVV